MRKLVLMCAIAISAIACGGSSAPKTANVAVGDMPGGETWTGVYFHPIFGYLHMTEEGTHVIGKWQRTDKSAWGSLSGTKTGNVLHFSWTEHKYGLVGPASMAKGRGYFAFKVNKEGIPELDGGYGLDDSEIGSDWHCVKQMKVPVDMNSITGDVPGGASQGTAPLE